MSRMVESEVEEIALAWLEGLGYTSANGPDLAPEGESPERTDYDQVILHDRLRQALGRNHETTYRDIFACFGFDLPETDPIRRSDA